MIQFYQQKSEIVLISYKPAFLKNFLIQVQYLQLTIDVISVFFARKSRQSASNFRTFAIFLCGKYDKSFTANAIIGV